jgi:mRNA interferase MazF
MNGTVTLIGEPMPTFKRGSIVKVPFPYTNRPVQQRRPALVVSSVDEVEGLHLLWVLMITSAANRKWATDIDLSVGYAEVGLPAPSLIRVAKIATIEADQAESWVSSALC